MRIRSIRPEFWSSEDIAAMDWHTRLIYIGLWSYVDDNGVGRDLERLIVTALFPLDEDLPECSRRVTGALQYLSDRNHITRFAVDGKRFLHIVKWSTHQRIEKASKGRYPLPTCENAEIQEPSGTTPVALPDMSAPGEGEKGRRGEGEKSSSSDKSDGTGTKDFETFWDVYDKKHGKKNAQAKWRLALKKPGVDAQLLTDAAAQYIDYQRAEGKHPTFTKDPAAWLNGEHWNDERVSRAAAPVRTTASHLRPVEEIEEPPPFLSPEEYEVWRRAKPGRR